MLALLHKFIYLRRWSRLAEFSIDEPDECLIKRRLTFYAQLEIKGPFRSTYQMEHTVNKAIRMIMLRYDYARPIKELLFRFIIRRASVCQLIRSKCILWVICARGIAAHLFVGTFCQVSLDCASVKSTEKWVR